MYTYNDIITILNDTKILTPDEEYAVFEFYRNSKNNEIKEKMLLKNMRLVHSVVKKYVFTGVEYNDLVQEGFLGLNKAFDMFEYERRVKFSTYAVPWIRAFIGRYLGKQGKMIRMPAYLNDMNIQMQHICMDYYENHGEMPDVSYIAKKLKTSEKNVQRVKHLSEMTNPISLNLEVERNGNVVVFGDILEDEKAQVSLGQFMESSISEEIWSYISGVLSMRELDVLKRRMGMNPDEKPESLDAIGLTYGVTRERIRQIEVRAIKKLREPQHKRMLRPFLEVVG